MPLLGLVVLKVLMVTTAEIVGAVDLVAQAGMLVS